MCILLTRLLKEILTADVNLRKECEASGLDSFSSSFIQLYRFFSVFFWKEFPVSYLRVPLTPPPPKPQVISERINLC